MSIAHRQILTLINRIIKESLQDGFLPSMTEVVTRLNKAMVGKVLGEPTTTMRPAPYRGESSSDTWNKTVDEIHDDLTTAYDESVDQTNRILTDFNYGETERQKLYNQIRRLEDKIKNLLLLNNNLDGYLYSSYDTFTDLSKVNTSQTSAFVDLLAGHVSPKQTSVGNQKASISSAIVAKKPIGVPADKVTNTEVQGMGFSNCLDDSMDTSWIETVVITADSLPSEAKFQIDLDLSTLNLSDVTRLSLTPHDEHRVFIEPEISEDGYNWSKLPIQDTYTEALWDFPLVKIKKLRITLTKKENDNVVLTGAYQFTFGLKNISLLKLGFEDTGILESLPHKIKDRQGKDVNLSKIALEVDEVTYPDTSIKYYLAIDSGEELEWQPITPVHENIDGFDNKPPKILDLKSISSTNPLVWLASQATRSDDKTYNGMPFYALGTAPQGTIIPESSVLHRGINQWKMEVYPYNWNDVHTPSNDDWIALPEEIEVRNITTKYIDMDFAKTSPTGIEELTADVPYGNFRWSTALYCKDATSFTAKLSIPQGNGGHIAVYVNGSQLGGIVNQGGELSVTYNLPAGQWSSIQILFYNNGTIDSAIRTGFNASEKVVSIRTDVEPLTRVDIFNLYYNVRDRETNFYAVDNGRVIINEFTKGQSARYDFAYKYYLDTNNNSVVFKAQFYKKPEVTTPPKLLSYKIRAYN